jgi:hypothetical protein
MGRIEILREQVRIIRSLASSFDPPALRETLLYVARRCEQPADEPDLGPEHPDPKPPAR